jgi:hypothetical protein
VRTTPGLLELSLLATLPDDRAASNEPLSFRQAAWCFKPLPPFSDNKQELLAIIEDYRQGLLPLIVPLTLLKHHLNRFPVSDWVHQQVYLNLDPKDLMLRNRV